jgi:hypothetical protein
LGTSSGKDQEKRKGKDERKFGDRGIVEHRFHLPAGKPSALAYRKRAGFQQSTRPFPIPFLSNVEGLLPKSILGDLFRNHYQKAVATNGFHSITILMKNGF